MADDEHVFPYIVAHVSMLYEVYSDYIHSSNYMRKNMFDVMLSVEGLKGTQWRQNLNAFTCVVEIKVKKHSN